MNTPTRYCSVFGTYDREQRAFFESNISFSNLQEAKKNIVFLQNLYSRGAVDENSILPRSFTYLKIPGGTQIGSLVVCCDQKHASEGGISDRAGSKYYQAIHYSLDARSSHDFIKYVLDINAVSESDVHKTESLNRETPLEDRWITEGDIRKEVSEHDKIFICSALYHIIVGKKVVIKVEDGAVFEERARNVLVQLYSLLSSQCCWEMGFTTYRRGHDFNNINLKKNVSVYICEHDALSGQDLEKDFIVIDVADGTPLDDDDFTRIVEWSNLTYDERMSYFDNNKKFFNVQETMKVALNKFKPDWMMRKYNGTVKNIDELIALHMKFPELSDNHDSEENKQFCLKIPEFIDPSAGHRVSFIDSLVSEIKEIQDDGKIIFTDRGVSISKYCIIQLRCLGLKKEEFLKILDSLKKNTDSEENDKVAIRNAIPKLDEIQKELSIVRKMTEKQHNWDAVIELFETVRGGVSSIVSKLDKIDALGAVGTNDLRKEDITQITTTLLEIKRDIRAISPASSAEKNIPVISELSDEEIKEFEIVKKEIMSLVEKSSSIPSEGINPTIGDSRAWISVEDSIQIICDLKTNINKLKMALDNSLIGNKINELSLVNNLVEEKETVSLIAGRLALLANKFPRFNNSTTKELWDSANNIRYRVDSFIENYKKKRTKRFNAILITGNALFFLLFAFALSLLFFKPNIFTKPENINDTILIEPNVPAENNIQYSGALYVGIQSTDVYTTTGGIVTFELNTTNVLDGLYFAELKSENNDSLIVPGIVISNPINISDGRGYLSITVSSDVSNDIYSFFLELTSINEPRIISNNYFNLIVNALINNDVSFSIVNDATVFIGESTEVLIRTNNLPDDLYSINFMNSDETEIELYSLKFSEYVNIVNGEGMIEISVGSSAVIGENVFYPVLIVNNERINANNELLLSVAVVPLDTDISIEAVTNDSNFVFLLQERLNLLLSLDILDGDIISNEEHGVYGEETKALFMSFQTMCGMEATGVVDSETWNAVFAFPFHLQP
jgi:peptidoglycan hydrolase-like protein with peptidoglycan-binding domain